MEKHNFLLGGWDCEVLLIPGFMGKVPSKIVRTEKRLFTATKSEHGKMW